MKGTQIVHQITTESDFSCHDTKWSWDIVSFLTVRNLWALDFYMKVEKWKSNISQCSNNSYRSSQNKPSLSKHPRCITSFIFKAEVVSELCTLLPILWQEQICLGKEEKTLVSRAVTYQYFSPKRARGREKHDVKKEKKKKKSRSRRRWFWENGAWKPVACCSPSKPVERLVNTDGTPFHTIEPDLANERRVKEVTFALKPLRPA